MKIGIITQARATSTRLPAKVLLTAGGRTYLEHHLDRLQATGLPVIVATTTNAADEQIVEIAEKAGVPVFRGSELDVLSRYAGAIREHELDGVVRVTSDCPLIDPEVVAEGVEVRAGSRRQPVRLELPRADLPARDGLRDLLRPPAAQADADATLPADREHVTAYLHQNRTGDMRLVNMPWTESGAQYRLTLDTEDDRKLLATLIEDFGAAELNVHDLVAIMDKHPELHALNEHIEQKKLGE